MSVERFHWDEDSVPRFWDRVAETRLRELSFGRFAARSLLLACRRHLAPTGIHLDLGAAFRLNPLPFVLVPAGALWLALARTQPSSRLARSLPWVLAGAIVAFTIWRNLPGYPFAKLSDGLRPPFVAATR